MVGAALLVAALAAILYPFIASKLAERDVDEVVATHLEAVAASGTDELKAAKAAAEAYNERLTLGNAGEEAEYMTTLSIDDSGMMGVLRIPCIDVTLPIFHGTDTDTLQKGIGHLYGSSMPIGGVGTHAVLSAHSGMAGQKMLTDLEQVKEGDVFYIDVLGETLVYRVDSILKVLPNDTAALTIEADSDRVTLVTCTPYGINSHRLLVRGVRLTEDEAEEASHTAAMDSERRPSTWTTQYLKGLLIGAAFGGVGVAVYVILKKRRKRNEG